MNGLSAREQGFRKGFQLGFQAAVAAFARGAHLAALYRFGFDELMEWRTRAPEGEHPPRAPLPGPPVSSVDPRSAHDH